MSEQLELGSGKCQWYLKPPEGDCGQPDKHFARCCGRQLSDIFPTLDTLPRTRVMVKFGSSETRPHEDGTPSPSPTCLQDHPCTDLHKSDYKFWRNPKYTRSSAKTHHNLQIWSSNFNVFYGQNPRLPYWGEAWEAPPRPHPSRFPTLKTWPRPCLGVDVDGGGQMSYPRGRRLS